MDSESGGEISEALRSHGWELASRIRFLREETRGDGRTEAFLAELKAKSEELARLIPVKPDIARIDFEISDTAEAANTPSGWVRCLRTVQVRNPDRAPDAVGVRKFSLLSPLFDDRANLSVAATSELIPSGD